MGRRLIGQGEEQLRAMERAQEERVADEMQVIQKVAEDAQEGVRRKKGRQS